MNVISSGPHILLFERDQQLVTLLSSELARAGYEVHTARTAVEVFDIIARFSVRLIMVDLAQAQAGRREFWVALDAQRRGRGVQVFTFRCTNVAGYGPDDPDERVDTVPTDLEVDGAMGIMKLVDAVRARVPGSVPPAPSPPTRPAPVAPVASNVPPSHGNGRSQPFQEMPQMPVPMRPAEPARTGISTFTDKIRAVIYPGGRNTTAAPEPTWPPNNPVAQPQPQYTAPLQTSDAQSRAQASLRFAEAEYPPHTYREEMTYQQAPPNAFQSLEQAPGRAADAPTERRSAYIPTPTTPASHHSGIRPNNEESSLDQLSRMLHESQPALRNTPINGNMQNNMAYVAPGLDIDQQELQEIRAQIIRAAQLDEAYERSTMSQPRPVDVHSLGTQLRASPIQDQPLEREVEYRRVPSDPLAQSSESYSRPVLSAIQPTQNIPPQASPSVACPTPFTQSQASQALPSQVYSPQVQTQPHVAMRDQPPDIALSVANHALVKPTQPYPEIADETIQTINSSIINELANLPQQIQASLQQNLAHRPAISTSDDMLLDIVKSLPPMAPASPAPQPPPVLNGRATRSLGSVLLEGHLVPEERLQVAQHVQRMMRGVDLNYQLGEILLMFKLLTPDQLLAASLVSYGMISTIQISALGRIRQELHAIGLEYDLESLVILFRILTPEQLREVRASWAS